MAEKKKKNTLVVKTLSKWFVFLWLYLSMNPYKSYFLNLHTINRKDILVVQEHDVYCALI